MAGEQFKLEHVPFTVELSEVSAKDGTLDPVKNFILGK